MAPGVVGRWRLKESGKQGGLREVEVDGGRPEVALRRRADAIGPLAKVDQIQVHLENRALGKVVLNLPAQEQVLEFAWDGVVVAVQVRVLSQLGGDSAAAFHQLRGPQVVPSSAKPPEDIDAVVLVEALIFTCDHR